MSPTKRAWSLCLPLLIVVACAPSAPHDEPVGTTPNTDSALTSSNGFVANGFVANGFVANGFVANGFVANGFVANGLSAPGLLSVPFTQGNLAGNSFLIDAIKADPIAGKLMQYIYSCAMPAGSSLGLDLDSNPATGDASGYDLVLSGALGLAPQWGEPGGSCDLSCQRWISACVLARTNAFGAKVDLSVRGPNLTSDPGWTLSVSPGSEEATTYNRREGSYFGNIFATQTQADGTVVWAPSMNACAGPNSDIPYLSLRFCSSTEDDCPINTVAQCAEDTAFSPAACDTTLGPSGESTNCYVDPSNKTADGLYHEVITVYLKDQLTAVCGNHICEVEGGETNGSCPQDCHSDTWAQRIEMGTGLSTIAFDGMVSLTGFNGWAGFNFLSVDASDNVVTGGYSADDVDLGGGTLPVALGRGYLAKYSSSGAHLWSERIGADVNAVATDSSGNIAVAATIETGVSTGKIYDAPGSAASITVPTTTGANELLVTKLDPSGARQWALTLGGAGSGSTFDVGDDRGSRSLAADPSGNWIVAGSFYGSGSFGASLTAVDQSDVFVTKISPSGSTVWGVRLGGVGDDRPTSVTSDASGNILVTTTESNSNAKGLYKLNSAGAVVWSKLFADDFVTLATTTFHKAIFDGAGNVYVSGTFQKQVDFGGGLVDGGSESFFLAKYNSAGALSWVKTVPGLLMVQDLRIDGYGDVIVFGQYSGAGIDFGAGPFTSRDPDTFLASYKADGTFVWAMPMNGYGNNLGGVRTRKGTPYPDSALFTGFGIDSRGRVVGTGVMDGFFLFDNRMLVNWVAPLSYDADVFVGSFVPPCSGDACDTKAPVFVPSTIPGTIVVQANLPADTDHPAPGAEVWFTVPSATDQDNAGRFGTAVVNCVPGVDARFPVGTTPVTCTAYDAHGNTATAGFNVVVRNTVPPTILGTPPTDPTVAPTAAGVVVNYTMPTAVDQIDGVVPVTCVPSNTSTFKVGVTTVNCSASDLAGNTAHASFPVRVVPAGDWNPPVITVPSGVNVTVNGAGGVVVNYTVIATDDVDGTVAVSCTPASGSTFKPGLTTVTCSAQDKAGNPATASFPVDATFSWSGFEQPVNSDGSSVFKLGRTVPVKFQLTGPSGAITNAVANLSVAKVTNNVSGSDIEAISTSAADTGNQFRYDASSGTYIFNLSTSNLSAGTWLLRVDLHDGVDRSVRISLK